MGINMAYVYTNPFNNTYLLDEVHSYPTAPCFSTKEKHLFYFSLGLWLICLCVDDLGLDSMFSVHHI